MRSLWMKLTVGAVIIVALGSVLIGLASPDGSVRGSVDPVNQGPRASPPPSQTPTPSKARTSEQADPPDARATPDPGLAPVSVAGTWPGRPKGIGVSDGRVDWCGSVRTTGAGEAERVFGREAVDAAACAAVTFVFDHRYSRLSLPRKTYEATDFDHVLAALDPSTAATVYRPRIASFIAGPVSNTAGEQLGLVLFTARDTPQGAPHASAGRGYDFYGPAFTGKGYRDRAVWINPTWSTVAIRVDRSTSTPRIEAKLSASAAVPVFAPATASDSMLTVPTRATMVLRHGEGSTWRINGWTISRGDGTYAPLAVN